MLISCIVLDHVLYSIKYCSTIMSRFVFLVLMSRGGIFLASGTGDEELLPHPQGTNTRQRRYACACMTLWIVGISIFLKVHVILPESGHAF